MSPKRRSPTSDEVFIDHITHIVEDINVANRDLLRFGFLTSTKIETVQNKSSYIQIIFNEGFIKITDSPDYIFDNNKISAIAALALETGKIEDVQGRRTLNGFHPMPLNNQKLSIGYLEDLVKEYEEQTAIDSSLISQKDLQISVLKEREDNYEQQIKLVKPKWYDNKYLWYTYGIASAIIPIYLASQIPGL